MPGVQTTLDIGGSRAMDQHYIQTAGLDDDNTSVTIDGMLINGLSSDGGSQYYLNDAFTHEMAVEMSGPDAETSSGGVLVTMIPREGGNELSGTFYYEAMNRDFTSSNLTPRLTNHGVRSVDRIDRSYEVNGSLGGPVVRDRVWFFYTGHRRIRDRVVLDSFHRDGSPGIDDRQVHGNNLRFTIQATRNNKLSVWYDRNNKLTGHNHTAGEDVETVSESRGLGKHGPRYAAQVKWTSTISSRMLSEVGWSTHRTDYNNRPQPGLPQDRPAGVRTCLATPCLEFDPKQVGDIHPWYSIVSRFDPEAIGIERMGNAEFDFGKVSQRYVLSAKLSYVTGSHNFKVGRPEQLRTGSVDLDQQRRHPEARTTARAVPRGDPDLEHAAHLQPPAQPRHRTVRPGVVDARPADAQSGHSPGVVQRPGRRERVAGGTLGAGPAVRRDHEPARLVSTSRCASAWPTTCSETRGRR